MLGAFRRGDPEEAYAAARALVGTFDKALDEAARLRFRVNFGTHVCDRCDGLRAGPGVAATCFQLRRCNYTNEKVGDLGQRRLVALRALGRRPG